MFRGRLRHLDSSKRLWTTPHPGRDRTEQQAVPRRREREEPRPRTRRSSPTGGLEVPVGRHQGEIVGRPPWLREAAAAGRSNVQTASTRAPLREIVGRPPSMPHGGPAYPAGRERRYSEYATPRVGKAGSRKTRRAPRTRSLRSTRHGLEWLRQARNSHPQDDLCRCRRLLHGDAVRERSPAPLNIPRVWA